MLSTTTLPLRRETLKCSDNLCINGMFGNDPFHNDDEEEDPQPGSPDLGGREPTGFDTPEPPDFDEPAAPTGDEEINDSQFGGVPDEGVRLPWEDLSTETKEELQEAADSPMCEHDEARQVVPMQSGGGIRLAGAGINSTEGIAKVVCPVCAGEWDTEDQSRNDSGPGGLGL